MYTVFALFLLFASVLIEAIIYSDHRYWKSRHKLALLIAIIIICSNFLFALNPNFWLLFVGFISIYKLINTARLYVNRLPDKHLKSIATKSFITLSLLQATIIITWQVYELVLAHNFTIEKGYNFVLVSAFMGGVVVFFSTLLKLYKSSSRHRVFLSNKELPTVSVCIAARNETPDLTSCLNSITETDYPKLEILVLDDDSQDSTAEIIKSFAQAGVRFVKQQKHNGEWLAKNNAYQTLLDNASGDLILFMGVDVRLHKHAINGLVEELVERDVFMMTIIPKRTKSGLIGSLIQPMRYWWELAVPNFIYKRKPALSTSWIVNREALSNIGGFKTYKRSIIPEEHLARAFDDIGKYAYIRTDQNNLVTTHKNFVSQWDTAVRTRYPHVHRRPETVFFQTIVIVLLVFIPFASLPFVAGDHIVEPYNILIILSVGFYIISHFLISLATNPMAAILAPINFPIAMLLDLYALHVSMLRYEFSRVIWKGRDIAPKKLKVYKSLPRI